MNTEERDELWELLGKAKQPEVSPYFSRNVLREVRSIQQDKPGFIAWIRVHWRWTAVVACGLTVAAGMFLTDRHQEDQQLIVIAHRVSASPDYQVINHLDELLDSEQNSIWLDGNSY